MTGGKDQAAQAPERAVVLACEADRQARAAVRRIAVRAAGRRGDARAGLRAAGRLELAARRELLSCIRRARDDGVGWQEIGALLELGAGAAERGLTVAEAAFDLAAGPPAGSGQVPAFTWQCHRCGRLVRDQGPPSGSSACGEAGHGAGCPRLSGAVTGADAASTR